ncbi:MAG: aspartate kinase [Anaerolineales bacterium]|jgi:aspartate kinase|nr:aspartate kinase [Anaerolineaceae bacterium]MDP6225164.1 aspartate kinase [Anaerolineales bacterium]MDP7643846.1 aspartate kinase [Anaerolineales bacterium]HJN41547.1 aspartate kinase [Anaerolineales bacterium]|tara:strand:+ start:3112 stop:4542 length:1431 start_codon:yes stop_codon:yes gene_type:complete
MTKQLVMKFGGTSVGSAEAIERVATQVQRARESWPQVVVVLSAMGGVTDALLAGANAAAAGDENSSAETAAALSEKHLQAIEGLLHSEAELESTRERVHTHVREFTALCHAVQVLGEASPRALDAISSLGERIAVHLVAARLRELDCAASAVRASELVRTDAQFQAANPDMEATCALTRDTLSPLLVDGVVPVVTGFMGATEDGAITTLGRGGSDYSAAIIAVALDADEVWICTDVDGVMTTDPRIAADARTLSTIAYREIAELASAGAKVVHPKAISPIMERGIRLWIRNTFNPGGPATQVLLDGETQNDGAKAVTAVKAQSLLALEGRGMLGVQGIAARTFAVAARADASVTLIAQTSSEQSICFAVPQAASQRVIAELEREFRHEFEWKHIDRVRAQDDIVIVTVVGAGMRHTPGIAGKVFSALGDRGLNVVAIAQGSSECSISLVVAAADGDDSVCAIHDLIIARGQQEAAQ